MFEPTIFECVLLAILTVLVIAGIICKLPKLEHYTNGGHYEPTKFEAVKGYRYEPAPVRNNPVQAWYWEGDLHD